MLAKIITKKLNYRIISSLLDKEDTVTSIAESIKSKKANVSKALRELEEKNIVVKRVIGRSHRYSFNYLNPQLKEIIRFLMADKADEINRRLENLLRLIDAYLSAALKENYYGIIIFGSALTGKYKDIDLFVILNSLKNTKQITENLRLINKKISATIGTKKELETGIDNNDALYSNIIGGIPFGCLELAVGLRYRQHFLRRKDIEERFIIGYREIQNCRRFKDDRRYIKNHLEKGVFDIIYAVLNYKQFTARNDREAEQLFRKLFKSEIPKSLKKAELFAEKMIKVIFY